MSRTSTRLQPGAAPWAVRLGGLALIPFLVGAGASWMAGPALRPLAAQALSTYAAVVVSFIGAIHWGLAFPQTRPSPALFLWGVVPAIVAWGAVQWAPGPALIVHAAMLAACLVVDRSVYPREGVAHWLRLRLGLTVVAVLCCLVGAWATASAAPH